MKNVSIFSGLFKRHSKKEKKFERNFYKMIFSNLLKKSPEEVTEYIKRLADLKEELKAAKEAIHPAYGLLFMKAISSNNLSNNQDKKLMEKHTEIHYVALKKYILNIEEEIKSIKNNLCILILEEIRINNYKYLYEIVRQNQYKRMDLIKEYLKISDEIVSSANSDYEILKKFF